MKEFTIRFHSSRSDYLIHAECALVGEEQALLVSGARMAQILDQSAAVLSSGEVSERRAFNLGRMIYDTFICDNIRELLTKALVLSEAMYQSLCLVLRFPPNCILQAVPWELLHDDSRFLTLGPAVSIVRYTRQQNPVRTVLRSRPLRMLFTSATPHDLSPLRVKEEERFVRRALVSTDTQLVVKHHINSDELEQLLKRAEFRGSPFHIWHHCGHGAITESGGDKQFSIILEDNRKSQWIDVPRCTSIISQCASLQMAVVNICHGANLIALAPALATLNVPIVIGMRSRIPDQSALAFARTFYSALQDEPVELALGRARLALAAARNPSMDWSLPMMFLRKNNYRRDKQHLT